MTAEGAGEEAGKGEASGREVSKKEAGGGEGGSRRRALKVKKDGNALYV